MMINLYCFVVILASKKLRSVEFVFVGAQTVVDLLISGLVNVFISMYVALQHVQIMCLSYSMYWHYVDTTRVNAGQLTYQDAIQRSQLYKPF